MENFEFIKYEPTPDEKHLGIATVKAYGKVILRYKIIKTKDGNNFFPTPASYKMPSDGKDIYLQAFSIDSNSDKEEIEQMIKFHLRQIFNKSTNNPSQKNNTSPHYQQESFLEGCPF